MKQFIANYVDESSCGEQVMSIYFGDWKTEDYCNNFINTSQDIQVNIQKNRDQIDTFFELQDKKDGEDKFLWVFYDDGIYCFKPEGKVYNNHDPIDDKCTDTAKSIKCNLVKKFDKSALPEIFANINSNQRYNRKTIAKLGDIESKIADRLLTNSSNSSLKIDDKDIFDYLSPLQFETLVFLIFNSDNLICSTYRGGTLPYVDLKFKDENGEVHYIQIKKKNLTLPEAYALKHDPKLYIIHSGDAEDIEKNIYGFNWLIMQISQQSKIKDWIRFNLDFFDLKGAFK